jgi:hypothetical protein
LKKRVDFLMKVEKNVKNNSVSIHVLPNKTYKFKLQLKDKFTNWTDVEETQNIFLPLNISVEQRGNTLLDASNSTLTNTNAFKLVCNTNILKTIEHQIIWLRDDREILLDERLSLFSTSTLNDTSYANSVLIFKSAVNRNLSTNYNGAYQCKLHIRYPDAGQGTFYMSELKKIKFDFYGNCLAKSKLIELK